MSELVVATNLADGKQCTYEEQLNLTDPTPYDFDNTNLKFPVQQISDDQTKSISRLKPEFPGEKAPPVKIAVPVIPLKWTTRGSDAQEQLLDQIKQRTATLIDLREQLAII